MWAFLYVHIVDSRFTRRNEYICSMKLLLKNGKWIDKEDWILLVHKENIIPTKIYDIVTRNNTDKYIVYKVNKKYYKKFSNCVLLDNKLNIEQLKIVTKLYPTLINVFLCYLYNKSPKLSDV